MLGATCHLNSATGLFARQCGQPISPSTPGVRANISAMSFASTTMCLQASCTTASRYGRA
jgi:hypothetical protein